MQADKREAGGANPPRTDTAKHVLATGAVIRHAGTECITALLPPFNMVVFGLGQCAFSTPLDDMIGDPILLWGFGHTHFSSDQSINGTRVRSKR